MRSLMGHTLLIPFLVCCSERTQFYTVTNSGQFPKNPSASDVAQTCQHNSPQHSEQTVTFEQSTTACEWGTNGNLVLPDGKVILDGTIMARREERATLPLPEVAVLCNIEVSSPQQQIRFDDEILLLLGNQLLASSAQYQMALTNDAGFYLYDWSKIAGQSYVNNSPYYSGKASPFCLGQAEGLSQCTIPRTETLGNIEMRFSPALIYILSARLGSEGPRELALITTGDNDPTDCQHSNLSLKVTTDYVKP